jgi:hypothetical protein
MAGLKRGKHPHWAHKKRAIELTIFLLVDLSAHSDHRELLIDLIFGRNSCSLVLKGKLDMG